METALFFKGREVTHIKNYARQNASLNSTSGGIAIFPELGVAGELLDIDSVVLFFPHGGNQYVRILPIQLSGGVGQYRHAGGHGLFLRFHLLGSVAKATGRIQELTEAMRDLLDHLEAVEVTDEIPEAPKPEPDDPFGASKADDEIPL